MKERLVQKISVLYNTLGDIMDITCESLTKCRGLPDYENEIYNRASDITSDVEALELFIELTKETN